MKFVLTLLISILSCSTFAQKSDSSTVVRRISAISWLPDGKKVLLNVMTIEKLHKGPPKTEKFTYDLASGIMESLPIDGNNLAVSPDGNLMAYIKMKENTINIYDLTKKTDKVIVTDSMRKYSLTWSGDGKKLAYNVQNGTSEDFSVEIYVYNIETKESKQITNGGKFKCYNPSWNPKNNTIVYYLEKGDAYDQLYLTDSEGSFQTKLTSDSTTNNNFPSWIDENTVLYTQSPDKIMSMDLKTKEPKQLEGIQSIQAKYNSKTGKVVYLDKRNKVMLYEMKNKQSTLVLDGIKLNELMRKK